MDDIGAGEAPMKLFAPRNGNAPAEPVIVTGEQVARATKYESAVQSAARWRSTAELLGFVCAFLAAAVIASIILLGTPRAIVYDRGPSGQEVIIGETADHPIPPTEVTIESSITAYLKCVREISTQDYAFIDLQTALCHRMTVKGSPAERDLLAYYNDHNPKVASRTFTRMIVMGEAAPVITRQGGSLTWTMSWEEVVTDMHGVQVSDKRYEGSITMGQEPALPTNRARGEENPGDVNAQSFILPVSD